MAVGLFLWAVLPRGVVLTRSARLVDLDGRPLSDTWEIRNASAIPVQISSVRVVSPFTYNTDSDRLEEQELGCDGAPDLGVELHLDDETAEFGRKDWQRPWSAVIVPPGDTLQARVGCNTTLLVSYRRSGRTGFFERREIAVHGYI